MKPYLQDTRVNDTPREAARVWFALWRSGKMTDAQIDAMETWLSEGPRHREALEGVAAMWEEFEAVRADLDVMVMRAKAAQSLRSWRATTLLGRAAAVFVCVTVGLAAVNWSLNRSEPTRYATNVGQQSTITLKDGSRVTLDTDSEVKVWAPAAQRRLELVRGRAFFEVAKDPKHPFIVATNRGSVTAVGTAFDVRNDAHGIKVVLVEGRVRIQPSKPLSKAVDMAAGHEFVGDGQTWRLSLADAQVETSWVRGNLVFQETPLAQIVEELNRYGADRITIKDPAVGRVRVSAILKSRDIDVFLNSLKLSKIAYVQRPSRHEILLVAPN